MIIIELTYTEGTTNLNNDDFEMRFKLSDMLYAILSGIHNNYPNVYYRGFFGSIRSFNTTITDTSTPSAQHPTLTIDYNTHNDIINIKSKGGFYQTFTVFKLINDMTNNRFNNMTNTYEIPEMIFGYERPITNSKTLIVIGNRRVFDKYMNYNYNGYGIISKRDLVEYEDRKESNQLAEVDMGILYNYDSTPSNIGKIGVYDNGNELRRYHKFSLTDRTIELYSTPNLTIALDSFQRLTKLGFINNYFTAFNLNNNTNTEQKPKLRLGDRSFGFTVPLPNSDLRYGNIGILKIPSSDRTWYKYNGTIGAKAGNPSYNQSKKYSLLQYNESVFTKLENFLIEKRNILQARLKLKEQYISPLPLLFNSKIELIDEQGVSKKGLITSISTTDKDPRLNLILRDYKYKTTDYIDLNEKGENDDIY